MSEPTSTTSASEPAGTAPEPQAPAAATPPEQVQPAATDDDEVVTLSRSDYKNLVSQRDRNHETARATEAWVMAQAQKEDIKSFLDNPDNKSKFPDVEVDDLMDAMSEDDFEKLAGQTQARIDKAAQRRLADIQKTEQPVLSPQDKAEQLKKLKKNPGSASFQQMLELENSPVTN